MSSSKVRTLVPPARALTVAALRRRSTSSGYSQEEQGQMIGTDGKGVRRLLAHGRKRADRLDLFFALEKPKRLAQHSAPGRSCAEIMVIHRRIVQFCEELPRPEAAACVSEISARRAA